MALWRIHRGEISALAPLWHSAWAASPAPWIFQRYELIECWSRLAQPEWWIFHTLSPPRLLPLVAGGGVLRVPGDGWLDCFDLLGPPTTPADRRCLSEALRACGQALELVGLPEGSGLAACFRESVWALRPFSACPLLPATTDHAAWQQRRRRSLRRLAALQRAGFRWRPLAEPAARNGLLAWMLDRKEAQFGGENVLNPRAAAWLQALVSRYPAWTELWCLEDAAATPASALLCWWNERARQRSAYMIAYNQVFADLSPGRLLLTGVADRTLQQRATLNFLTGEQPYKRWLAEDRLPLWIGTQPATASIPPAGRSLVVPGKQCRRNSA